MIQLLSALICLPCFSSVLQSEGAQSVVYGREIATGYLSVAALSSGWGGIPQTVIYKLDQYGMVSSEAASFSGEPVASADFQNGIVTLCADTGDETATLVFIDNSGTEQWETSFTGQYLSQVTLCTENSTVFLTSSGRGFIEVVGIDSNGNILWETDYPEIDISVRDISVSNDNLYILGTSEQPGWQSDLCVLLLDLSGGNPELHRILPETGRYSPEAIVADSRGVFVLVNTMTEMNNMCYETQLIKLDQAFSILWMESLSGTSWNRGTDLVSLPEGDFVLCGWTNSLPMSESNRSDLLMCRYTETGELLWERKHGSSSPDYGLSIASVSDGGFAVSGCVTEDVYQGLLLKTDSLGLLETQSAGEAVPTHFEVSIMNNPVRNALLSMSVEALETGYLNILVHDLTGRIVQEISSVVAQGENILNLSVQLPNGVYSVRVCSESDESSFRVVVCGGGK